MFNSHYEVILKKKLATQKGFIHKSELKSVKALQHLYTTKTFSLVFFYIFWLSKLPRRKVYFEKLQLLSMLMKSNSL